MNQSRSIMVGMKGRTMAKREEDILDAATAVFVRYGVQRSSMSDVAKEANVARQTLYNAFSNKDEILRATIKLFSERCHERINEELSDDQGLKEQLDVVFRHTVIAPFKRVKESPNAADFIEGYNQAAKEEIDAQDERIRALIERLLKPYNTTLRTRQSNAKKLSDFVQRSSAAAKHTAADEAHLDTLLNTLVLMVLSMVGALDDAV